MPHDLSFTTSYNIAASSISSRLMQRGRLNRTETHRKKAKMHYTVSQGWLANSFNTHPPIFIIFWHISSADIQKSATCLTFLITLFLLFFVFILL